MTDHTFEDEWNALRDKLHSGLLQDIGACGAMLECSRFAASALPNSIKHDFLQECENLHWSLIQSCLPLHNSCDQGQVNHKFVNELSKFNKIITHPSIKAEVSFAQAMMYESSNNFDEAFKCYRDIISMPGVMPAAKYIASVAAGDVLMKLNRNHDAFVWYATAIGIIASDSSIEADVVDVLQSAFHAIPAIEMTPEQHFILENNLRILWSARKYDDPLPDTLNNICQYIKTLEINNM